MKRSTAASAWMVTRAKWVGLRKQIVSLQAAGVPPMLFACNPGQNRNAAIKTGATAVLWWRSRYADQRTENDATVPRPKPP